MNFVVVFKHQTGGGYTNYTGSYQYCVNQASILNGYGDGCNYYVKATIEGCSRFNCTCPNAYNGCAAYTDAPQTTYQN